MHGADADATARVRALLEAGVAKISHARISVTYFMFSLCCSVAIGRGWAGDKLECCYM